MKYVIIRDVNNVVGVADDINDARAVVSDLYELFVPFDATPTSVVMDNSIKGREEYKFYHEYDHKMTVTIVEVS